MKRILICILALGLAGCSNDDDPVKPPRDTPDPIPPRSTPKSSVEYYRLAWQSRDSTRVDSVLASDYQGTSTDLGSNPVTLSFVKSDEIRALHGMDIDVDLTSVSVDFGPQGTWMLTSYPADPPEWRVVILPNVAITLTYSSGDVIAVSPSNDDNEFRLKPVAAGSDTTWEIVRWKEVHTSP